MKRRYWKQAAAYEDLVLAYSKLQKIDEMYFAIEKVIDIYKEIEKTLSDGEKEYMSPLLNGLVFSKDSLTFGNKKNSLERYYDFLIKSNTLKQYSDDERFISILNKLKEEIRI